MKQAGHNVWVPALPEPDRADLSLWTDYVLAHAALEDAILVGHSAGANLVLSVLQKSSVRVRRAILVAGFIKPLGEMSAAHVSLLRQPDWAKIKQQSDDFFFINADNDPWGCTDRQGALMREKLGGTQLVVSGGGHFGSHTFKQPIPEFPLLKALCLMQG